LYQVTEALLTLTRTAPPALKVHPANVVVLETTPGGYGPYRA
jgi:hypothetical protein